MKGYLVELKEGTDKETAKKSLENVLGKGYVAFHEGSGRQETDVLVSEGMYAKVNVYHVVIDFPKPGLMAFIGAPAHIKLMDLNGNYQLPHALKDNIARIIPCDLEKKIVGRQG